MQLANVNAFAKPFEMKRQQSTFSYDASSPDYGLPFFQQNQDQQAASPSTPAPSFSGGIGGQIYEGLKKRGLPSHVAEAFVHNMKDESGLRPDINEIEPLVKGSRGGFGLYQLTGPRRRQYEAFAQSRGVDVGDVDAQLDFLTHELDTTEKRAAKRILGASTTGAAAAAIVNDFLRPAEQHRKRRTAKYLALDGGAEPSNNQPFGFDQLTAMLGI